MRHHVRGFTLLELIVVIAIIGVLSVIILPSFKNALARANDTKLKQFAITLDKKYDVTTKYDFEEGSGLSAKDTSINQVSNTPQNNLIIPGSGVTYSQNTYSSSSQYSLSFGGTAGASSQSKTLPSLDNKSFSISFWFNMNSSGDGCMLHKGNHALRERLSICYYLDSIYVSAYQFPESNFGYKVSPQQWHHFVMSFDSNTYLAVVYIDSVRVGQVNFGGVISNSDNYPLVLGKYPNNTFFYSGYIDDFRVYENQVIVK
jgi:prepilin-type N-terminal cleavage/methylation domain-containing protein